MKIQVILQIGSKLYVRKICKKLDESFNSKIGTQKRHFNSFFETEEIERAGHRDIRNWDGQTDVV